MHIEIAGGLGPLIGLPVRERRTTMAGQRHLRPRFPQVLPVAPHVVPKPYEE